MFKFQISSSRRNCYALIGTSAYAATALLVNHDNLPSTDGITSSSKLRAFTGLFSPSITLSECSERAPAPTPTKINTNQTICPPKKVYTASEEYPYFTPWHKSLMRKHLTPEVYTSLHSKKTQNGWAIEDVIASGVACGYSLPRGIGCMAGDYESYSIFGALFDPIIKEYHNFTDFSTHTTDLNPANLKSLKSLTSISDQSKYVLSTRIRVSRSITSYAFPAACSRGERREIENLSKKCVESLTGDLAGMYISLKDMDNEENDDLIQRHILFDNPDEWAITAGLGKDWPDSRGVFVNVARMDDHPDFIVWVNEEDHLRIMCLQKGGNIFAVFEKMVRGLNEIERVLNANDKKFLHDDRLGYISGCPSNLGTGLRASMHVKLIHLRRKRGFLKMCTRMGLEARGKHGEKDKHNSGIVDISNVARLGFSEVQLIQCMISGVGDLIEIEKRLERGEPFNCEEYPGI